MSFGRIASAAIATCRQVRPTARICTFECTFCADCAEEVFHGVCPNCGGNFVPRPIRPAGKLAKYPPSTKRVLKDHGGCLERRRAVA